MWGFAQRMALVRKAFLRESQSFTQPVRSLDSAQPQWQPVTAARCSSPGVSARAGREQASKQIPAASRRMKREGLTDSPRRKSSIVELCSGPKRESIARIACEFCNWGYGTRIGLLGAALRLEGEFRFESRVRFWGTRHTAS